MRLPGEFESQRAVWLTWPGNPATWIGTREKVQRDHAMLIATCARFQMVELICPACWQADCENYLRYAGADEKAITVHDWPVNDAWTRDHGPVFVQAPSGPAVVDLPYNAWGGKFPPWDDDDRIARRVSELRKVPTHRFPMFGEGGGLESNGQGTLIVTESVWLNPNRNPGVHRSHVEAAFREAFGVHTVIWLRAGMASDDTDGHIDTLARFISPDTVVVPLPQEGDPDAEVLRENRQHLKSHFEVVDLPHPRIDDLPASYANFLILNGSVLIPQFETEEDEEALEVFRKGFPSRQVLGIPSRRFLQEGGAVHCLTANEWT